MAEKDAAILAANAPADTTSLEDGDMKIGVNRWTMPGGWSLDACFAAAREAGFDSIEINIEKEGELTPDTGEDAARRIARAAADAHVEISSLSSGLGWAYPLTDDDPATRSRGLDITRAQIRLANWLGARAVLCVPGAVTEYVQYDVAYNRAQTALKEVLGLAQAMQIVIGVENVWNKFLLSPIEMRQFVDAFSSPWVKVYFDAGNVLVFGYPQHWIRILGQRIVRVHVKDFKCGIGNITGFCNLLQGDLKPAAVKTALQEVGYDGYVTAEVDGYPGSPQIGLKHIAECMRAAFG